MTMSTIPALLRRSKELCRRLGELLVPGDTTVIAEAEALMLELLKTQTELGALVAHHSQLVDRYCQLCRLDTDDAVVMAEIAKTKTEIDALVVPPEQLH